MTWSSNQVDYCEKPTTQSSNQLIAATNQRVSIPRQRRGLSTIGPSKGPLDGERRRSSIIAK
jgi:hypothetical protein